MNLRTVNWLIPLKLDERDGSFLLFSACDTKYLHYAVSLIRSVDLFSPGTTFVLHLINPSAEAIERVQKLALSLGSTHFAVSFEEVDLSGLAVKQKHAYYASARFPQIASLLEEYKKSVFSLDADSLVVNPIDLDFSDKKDAEIVLVRRDTAESIESHLAVATGSIWFKPTPNVFNFAKNVAAEIDNQLQERTLKWFVDQVVFYQQMKAMQGTFKIYNLKRKYADWDFREDSIVWAGKGRRKDNDMRFFMLQAMLSDSDSLSALAKQLWNKLTESREDLPSSTWMASRIEAIIHQNSNASGMASYIRNDWLNRNEPTPEAHKSLNPKVVIYLPRLDLPWKRSQDSALLPPLLGEDVLNLRLHWKEFVVRMANVIEHAGLRVKIIELPAWEINRDLIESSGAHLAFIPHRCNLDFDVGNTPVLFYMQEYYRWVFVVDHNGWSAASSLYPFHIDSLRATQINSYDEYRRRLQHGELGSKFAQPIRKTSRELLAARLVPTCRNWIGIEKVKPYIFFPLQIPHDQSIRYFSDLNEITIVESLIKWARKNNVSVVMKPHPVNPKSMRPFKELADGKLIFWSDAHVYDLVANSIGVYTINSGVGFESLFYGKPVVTFGRVEYDCVTFHANPENLDQAWDYCRNADLKSLKLNYSRFINWFLEHYAVDMSRPGIANARLREIAKGILTQVRAADAPEEVM